MLQSVSLILLDVKTFIFNLPSATSCFAQDLDVALGGLDVGDGLVLGRLPGIGLAALHDMYGVVPPLGVPVRNITCR